ncbi:beta-ketoacyl-[acyl-carrier-protein] synthase family protein [Acidihalobacter ferrooxydans]|uniref:Beta-ketoacyl-[acyl-carrier-protein] synthase II n=1 Tax=Acidihalobacter ferrooxydans TaxID=1765967 RepID=A0A1P8UDW6_9GAMM|nr:beta-ketoacyl-[acyl-carrier-protein] synthase family protein [Acidihalobacter ferrooxydans]APZ42057.1 beta-ketoacyl-[acyl-carrier-protein] synthase II [Acidihalobacter ferrooxydans]
MQPLHLTAYTATSALGHGNAAHADALRTMRGGLRPCDFEDVDLDTWIGRVTGIEDAPITGHLAAYDCRNNRLAALALEADGFAAAVADARRRLGAARIGVFLGTSTSGILETEHAYRRRKADGALPADYRFRESHEIFSLTDFVRRHLGLRGPALTLSTACSSSAKVFATAARHIQVGWCDAAVVGGVDSLCQMTLYGFHSLQLVSAEPCRPLDAQRNGLSIGEAGSFALLEAAPRDNAVALLGYGESADAYHIARPEPNGRGALEAMRAALTRAGLDAAGLDYVNLHATGTPANDSAESRALSALLDAPPTSGTKGWTGHTLGAAGALEAVFCALSIEHGFLPGTLNLRTPDPAIGLNLVRNSRTGAPRRVLSNSLGFGGSNCSLLLGAV